MPSPFPGMDPFLEHRAFFPDLHSSLIYCIRQALQRTLPPPYYAVLNERLWVESRERLIEPDVDILHGEFQAAQTRSETASSAVATQPIVISIPHDERREVFIDIMTRSGIEERLVTSIEVLSITNKTPGENGRNLYLRKQDEVIDAPVGLVEIDLLRAGQHTTAVTLGKLRRRAGPFDYHVCIKKSDNWIDRFVYTFRMQDKLPEIEIPLLPGDPPVKLALQGVFDQCYDDGPFRRRVPYELDRIEPPLTPEQAAWAAEILKNR